MNVLIAIKYFLFFTRFKDYKLSSIYLTYNVHYKCLTTFQDPMKTVTDLAKFLNVPHTDEFVQEIVERCSFDNLKNNKIDSTRSIHPEKKSTLFRKGTVV